MAGAARTAFAGAVVLLAAAAFDLEPLYAAGIVLLVLGGCAALWVRVGVRGIEVARTVAGRRVEEEDPFRVTIDVRSTRALLPAGEIRDPLLPSPAPLAAGRRRTRVTIDVRFARRGPRTISAPSVVVRDPVGLAAREVRMSLDTVEVLVLPRVTDVVASGDGGGDGRLAGQGLRAFVAAEVELDGLRPHRQGSPASRIHWPAYARGAGLVERRLRADTDALPLIVLDPRHARSLDDLDAAVRAAASLTVHLARHGGCAVLLPRDRRPTHVDSSLASWPHLHARLAVVDGSHAPAVSAIAARHGTIVYVCAHRGGPVPRVLAQAPGDGRILVIPGGVTGRQAAFVVAGCEGVLLGQRRRRTVAA